METNWYAVYTRPQKEKRASGLLTSLGIENFIPLNKRVFGQVSNLKTSTQPLISSLLFVCADEVQLQTLSKLSDISLVYWKSMPAIIKEEEVDMLKNLSINYINLRMEKMAVDLTASVSMIDENPFGLFAYNHSYASKPVKVFLPSLGYVVYAEKEMPRQVAAVKENIFFSFFQRRNKVTPALELN